MTNITTTTELTKKLIAQELLKIKVDHSITISEEDFKLKVNLLFDDLKNCTAEKFIATCQELRKKQLFGKLPANIDFVGEDKFSQFKHLLNGK